MSCLRFVVRGDPAPQGSKRPFRNKHTGKIQEVESSVRIEPWRQDVRQAVLSEWYRHPPRIWEERGLPTKGPVRVAVTFAYPRPKSHYRTGRNSHLLRYDAPYAPMGRKDDIDKLLRGLLDAIASTGLVFHDDGQVIAVGMTKAYLDNAGFALTEPGAQVQIWTDDDISMWRPTNPPKAYRGRAA